MSVLTQHVDKAYCINLKRRQDRWKKCLMEFKKNNLDDIERYQAIDGKLYDWSSTIYDDKLLKGELGVLETHINIITEAVEKEYSSIAIFEDDVYFTPEIAKLEEYLSDVPSGWDMIYLGGNHTYGKVPKMVTDKIMKLENTFATEGVIIRNTLFQKILDITKDREHQIDKYYSILQKTNNVYGCYPNITLQKIDYSDIQNKVVDYFNNNNNINKQTYATKNIFNNEVGINKNRNNKNY
jgi:GR25 family glycosyltransferase involved in LPS biosynthesis